MIHTVYVMAEGAMLGVVVTGLPIYAKVIRFLIKELVR